ncbi:uncharacterized protein LOC127093148 [Lathyrus oleraceus]|uniref:Uncharacterized protein n=1 Tax=Pisum sativum TaxID=3888 RepID=A0A9D4W5N1_PEA|nr:uncharacterized protein LOC127093148 [Pisum sativum]XP_050888007.1 uncharacterized protein LOC127093148 [Pisum sativum]XP_050888008.1 uncharacterized protein LOC127093148 [Pisum sativum]KAI5395149.1 hypothetical protein KIW84_061664 [Pisum sativum]
METLVVVEQHKEQFCNSTKPQVHGRFEYSSSKDFIGTNCRTFESGLALLPTTPLKSFDESPNLETTPKSTPIPINGKGFRNERVFDEIDGSILLSELWAGPTYSNSPPPSSLPIPKFSVRPKRTVSLDLPGSSPEIELRVMAKSAPSSPTRERLDFTRDLFVNADSATKTLRRILNLNINDE